MSRFIETVKDKYDQITVLDKMTYANQVHRIEHLKNVEVFELDCANKSMVYEAFKCIEPVDLALVAHSESHVCNSIENPGLFLQSNTVGAANVMEACKDFQIGKTILLSTDEVIHHEMPRWTNSRRGILLSSFIGPKYVDFNAVPHWEFTRMVEEQKYEPRSPYSSSKAAAELVAKSYRETYNLPVSIARLCNIYGPNQHKEKLIPKTIDNAWNKRSTPLFKTQAFRDWLYVDDACSALEQIIEVAKYRGDIWHSSAYNEMETRKVVELIYDKLNAPLELIEEVPDRAGYDLSYSISSEKLRATGWKPQVEFEDGLDRTIVHFGNGLERRSN